MAQEHIFIVEDDAHIRELLGFNLETTGYRVSAYETGEEALIAALKQPPDLMLLDLMLPGIDGMEVCRRLREATTTRNLPIIMLTAKGEEVDRVLGLELGADDYVVKPFSVREVLARIKAVLRRSAHGGKEDQPQLRCAGITVYINRREVHKGDRIIAMPMKEFDLLTYLMKHRGNVLTREQLLDQVWGYDYIGETRTVDVHIRHLRQKIEDHPEEPTLIETVRGVGYRFRDKA